MFIRCMGGFKVVELLMVHDVHFIHRKGGFKVGVCLYVPRRVVIHRTGGFKDNFGKPAVPR